MLAVNMLCFSMQETEATGCGCGALLPVIFSFSLSKTREIVLIIRTITICTGATGVGRTGEAVALDEIEKDGLCVHPVAEKDLVLHRGRCLLLLVPH